MKVQLKSEKSKKKHDILIFVKTIRLNLGNDSTEGSERPTVKAFREPRTTFVPVIMAVVIGEFVSFFVTSREPDLKSLVVVVLELAVSSVSLFVMV
jgi:hypothetical protein